MLSCEKFEINLLELIPDFSSDKYYSTEIIPNEFLDIYGTWKFLGTYGGGRASINPTTEDQYLKIQPYGIYAVISGDTLREFGKIEPAIGSDDSSSFISINFIHDTTFNSQNYFLSIKNLLYLNSSDTLGILSTSYTDMPSLLYQRVK